MIRKETVLSFTDPVVKVLDCPVGSRLPPGNGLGFNSHSGRDPMSSFRSIDGYSCRRDPGV